MKLCIMNTQQKEKLLRDIIKSFPVIFVVLFGTSEQNFQFCRNQKTLLEYK